MKRFLCIFLIFVMCIVPLTVSAARDVSQEEILAQNLKELGVLRGVSDSEFDLLRAPTRVEALVMLIRLLGKEAQALDEKNPHPFSDVPAWADDYVGYAYKNRLTNGISDTEFGTENANIQTYLTFVLRSLGYSDADGDFSYSEPFSLSQQAGILPAMVDKENFLRADCVIISYVALESYMKNSIKTLASKLIDEGVFSEADFLRYYDKNALDYNATNKKELDSEAIYKKCSPAVFFVEVYDKNSQLCGTGSGFFIDADGTAVTNYHVINGMSSAKITLSDTQEVFDVEGVYDFSEENDWAIIKVSGKNFKTLDIGDKSTIVGGATVYAIGSPMGLQNTISQGLISNTNRVIEGVTYIQTSAAISKGSSGGAFINKYGEVIGITSAGFLDGENLGLAIPVSVFSGFKKETVTPLGEINKPKPTTPGAKLAADDALYEFILTYQNELLSGCPAFVQTTMGSRGFVERYLLIESDSSIRLLVREEFGFDSYYFAMILSGNGAGEMYYDYESGFTRTHFSGQCKVPPEKITRSIKLDLEKIEGNVTEATEEVIASDYLVSGLDFVNTVFGWIKNAVGEYTVRDLGFLNFE